MPTTENFELPYPNTSDEPNIPKDFQSLATATETALQELKDSVSQMPRIFTGSTVLKFSNTNRARMWTVAEFETTFGVPFTDYQHYFVGIMNGDSNSTRNSATVSIGATYGVEAISQNSLNGSFRFTWMVVVY